MPVVPFLVTVMVAFASAIAQPVLAQQPLVIKPLAEQKVAALPDGPLFWRVESFPSATDARGAAGATSLVAESAGKAWLFTLGAPGGSTPGGSTPGGTRMAEVGPIARIDAAEYLLRINEATGAPGAVTPIHSHPGSEAFYVLSGEQSIRGRQGTLRVQAGQAEAGGGSDLPMQVSSSGAADLHALVMFVVDAKRAFSSPATLP